MSPAVSPTRHTSARICRRVPSAKARNIISMVIALAYSYVRINLHWHGGHESCTTNSPRRNGASSGRCSRTNRAVFLEWTTGASSTVFLGLEVGRALARFARKLRRAPPPPPPHCTTPPPPSPHPTHTHPIPV